jgi:hypothetical protein
VRSIPSPDQLNDGSDAINRHNDDSDSLSADTPPQCAPPMFDGITKRALRLGGVKILVPQPGHHLLAPPQPSGVMPRP